MGPKSRAPLTLPSPLWGEVALNREAKASPTHREMKKMLKNLFLKNLCNHFLKSVQSREREVVFQSSLDFFLTD